MNNFLHRIENAGPLSGAEAKIAAYLERGYPLSLSESINQVSAGCGVSVATISRFIHRLGYTAFSDLKAEAGEALKSRLTSPIERYSARQDQGAGAAGAVTEYLDTCARNIAETNHRIDTAAFAAAVDELVKAPRLFVTGAASASALAQYFTTFARYLRPDVHLLPPDISTLPHRLADVQKGDVLLAVSHYRVSSVTTGIARFFHQAGNAVILLSDRASNPITPYAAVTIPVFSGGTPMFNSRVATLAVLEALFNGMIPRCEKTMKTRFAVMEQAFEAFNVYSK